METYIHIILPLVLTGLGFITYKHPPIARQILTVLFILVVVYQVIIVAYSAGQMNAYTKSSKKVLGSKMKILKTNHPKIFNTNIDSIKGYSNNYDSILAVVRLNTVKNDYERLIPLREQIITDSIYNHIEKQSEISSQRNLKLRNISWIAFGTIIIFYILTFVFERNAEHNKKNVDDTVNQGSTKETT